jgi:hypothetical protein
MFSLGLNFFRMLLYMAVTLSVCANTRLVVRTWCQTVGGGGGGAILSNVENQTL